LIFTKIFAYTTSLTSVVAMPMQFAVSLTAPVKRSKQKSCVTSGVGSTLDQFAAAATSPRKVQRAATNKLLAFMKRRMIYEPAERIVNAAENTWPFLRSSKVLSLRPLTKEAQPRQSKGQTGFSLVLSLANLAPRPG
jgi:hypothetical protein